MYYIRVMPTLTPDDNYESYRPIYRAICTVTACGWVYEGDEHTHPDVVKARAVGHAYKEGHAVDVRFDILNTLCDRVYPRRDER